MLKTFERAGGKASDKAEKHDGGRYVALKLSPPKKSAVTSIQVNQVDEI